MDIEQLKIVAEAIGGLGNDAKWGVIAWVAFTEGVKVLVAAIIVFGLGSVVKHLVSAIKDYNENNDSNAEFVRTVGNMMGVDIHGYVAESDRSRVLKAVGSALVEYRSLKQAYDSKSSLKDVK